MAFNISFGSFSIPITSPTEMLVQPSSDELPSHWSLFLDCRKGAIGNSSTTFLELQSSDFQKIATLVQELLEKTSVRFAPVKSIKQEFNDTNYQISILFKKTLHASSFKKFAAPLYFPGWEISEKRDKIILLKKGQDEESLEAEANTNLQNFACHQESPLAHRNSELSIYYGISEKWVLKSSAPFLPNQETLESSISTQPLLKLTPDEKDKQREFLQDLLELVPKDLPEEFFESYSEKIDDALAKDIPFKNEMELEVFLNQLNSCFREDPILDDMHLEYQNRIALFFEQLRED